MNKRTYTPEQARRRDVKNRLWKAAHPQSMRAAYRKHDLKRYYGLTPEQYDEMFVAQGGVCAICKQPPKDNGKRRLVVDHDHKTKRNRGLLCPPCNVALNGMERVPDWSTKAAQYLTGSKEIN